MPNTSNRRAASLIAALFAVLLLGIALLTGKPTLLRAEQEDSPAAASPVESESAAALPASAAPEGQTDRAEQDAPEAEELSEQARIEAEAQLEAEHAAAYREAEELLAAGSQQAAWKVFTALEDYRDSRERAAAIYESVSGQAAPAEAEIGDTVILGLYEQDGNRANGPEWIEWLVLDKADGRILVISKYGLSSQAYNVTNSSVTWDHSSIRDFLNRHFFFDAFSEAEQARIPTVTVRAEQNPYFDTDPGADTEDKVFLLSIAEADQYFDSDEARKCLPTPNTAAQGACVSLHYFVDGSGTCWWWLRQAGRRNNTAACIDEDGSIHPSGYDHSLDDVAVRPALWIDIE